MMSDVNSHDCAVIKTSTEGGFSILEVLATLAFVLLFAVGISQSLVTSMRVAKHTEGHFIASMLASDRVEQLAAIDIGTLDATFDEIDEPVSLAGFNIQFLRDTSVIVNADNSRTISVVVRSTNSTVPTEVSFQTRFAVWE